MWIFTFLKNQKETNKDIRRAGGGQQVTYFRNYDLIDKMIISVIPTIPVCHNGQYVVKSVNLI